MDKKRVNAMKITKRLVIVVTSVVLALYTAGVLDEGVLLACTADLWNHVLACYGVLFELFCITPVYITYYRFTVIDVLVFTTKYLPTGLYLYNLLKDVCRSLRARSKKMKVELEDIVLQIAIVKTKQCVSDTECEECASQVERAAAQVRAARARVRDLVAADDALRLLIEGFGRTNLIDHHTSCDDHHMMELLKDLAHDKNSLTESSIDSDPRDFISMSEKSEYSSRSDAELEKDCQIKIIKVTNVYKVAYLKHYIKQKRLRRASRHAVLKKKMESIKKLLEDWQKALNLVMNDTYMLEGRGRDMSGDAGDGRDMSGDAGDHRGSDTGGDEYNPAWGPTATYTHFYQEPGRSPCQEDFECQEYENYCGGFYEEIDTSVYEELEPKYEGGGQCQYEGGAQCQYEGGGQCQCARLPRLPEETSSQLLAIQDVAMADHNDSNERILAI